jgi:hypothetical protein
VIASTGYRSLLDRMLSASLLETEAYEHTALDPSTRTQATLAVSVTSVAAGAGMLLSGGLTGFALGTLAAAAGWVLCVLVAYRLATRRFGVPRTMSNLNAAVRSVGLATSPRVFLILTLVPEVGFLVGLAVHAWVAIATVLAVRVALDVDFRSALLTAGAGSGTMFLIWTVAYVVVTL